MFLSVKKTTFDEVVSAEYILHKKSSFLSFFKMFLVSCNDSTLNDSASNTLKLSIVLRSDRTNSLVYNFFYFLHFLFDVIQKIMKRRGESDARPLRAYGRLGFRQF